jgi:peptide-methionine (S)-S-oxide reductase
MNRPFFAATAALALLVAGAAPAADAYKTAIFAGGCFWSAQHDIEHTPGVKAVAVGYSGGTLARPDYENHEGHLETIRVTYDPRQISYARLVDTFFHHIDPTDPGGQICDQGPSYRSAVFVADPAEKAAAEQVKAQVGATLHRQIATQILPAKTFWMGEDYHQDYARKNPINYNAYRIGCGRDARLHAVWSGH